MDLMDSEKIYVEQLGLIIRVSVLRSIFCGYQGRCMRVHVAMLLITLKRAHKRVPLAVSAVSFSAK